MRVFGTLVLCLLFFSCATVKVQYDYVLGSDFTKYATYNYFSDMETGLGELDEKRLLKILDTTLQAKGFSMAEQPDFYINILSREYRNAPNNTVGVGVGGTGSNVGGGISLGIPLGNSGWQREIQFDFVDATENVLYWQAITESGFRDNASPSVKEALLQKVITKAFSKFPPEAK